MSLHAAVWIVSFVFMLIDAALGVWVGATQAYVFRVSDFAVYAMFFSAGIYMGRRDERQRAEVEADRG